MGENIETNVPESSKIEEIRRSPKRERPRWRRPLAILTMLAAIAYIGYESQEKKADLLGDWPKLTPAMKLNAQASLLPFVNENYYRQSNDVALHYDMTYIIGDSHEYSETVDPQNGKGILRFIATQLHINPGERSIPVLENSTCLADTEYDPYIFYNSSQPSQPPDHAIVEPEGSDGLRVLPAHKGDLVLHFDHVNENYGDMKPVNMLTASILLVNNCTLPADNK